MAVLGFTVALRRDRKDLRRATAPVCGTTVPRVLPEGSGRTRMSTRSLDLATREGRQERRARLLRLEEAQRQAGPAPSPPVARHRRGRIEEQSPAVRLRKSRRNHDVPAASEEPRVDIVMKLREMGVPCPDAQPLPTSRFWLHPLFVARTLGLRDPGSARHDGTRQLDTYMKTLREDSMETTAEIAGTNVYYERQSEWARSRQHLFYWFVHDLSAASDAPLPSRPSCGEQKRVVKELLAEGNRELFIALVEGDVEQALDVGKETLRAWSNKQAFRIVLNTEEVSFTAMPEGENAFADRRAMMQYTQRVCESVAQLQEPVLLPSHRERYGCGYGGLPAPAPAPAPPLRPASPLACCARARRAPASARAGHSRQRRPGTVRGDPARGTGLCWP